MSLLDDLGDAVKDVASTVGDGIGSLAEDAYSTVLSPAQEFAMKGLGAAGSTVLDVFGDLDITDIGEAMGAAGELYLLPLTGGFAIARQAHSNAFDSDPIVRMIGDGPGNKNNLLGGLTGNFSNGMSNCDSTREFNQGIAEPMYQQDLYRSQKPIDRNNKPADLGKNSFWKMSLPPGMKSPLNRAGSHLGL